MSMWIDFTLSERQVMVQQVAALQEKFHNISKKE